MSDQLTMRLSGSEIGVHALVTAVRRMPDVQIIREGDPDATGRAATRSHRLDLRLGVADATAKRHVGRRIETLASGAGVDLEWLQE